ncbi:A/G-specific adenine glycosylase [Marinoscillum furvescens]|uniref:Adenine DNA glycosylase n=1 Tax=Marinoscillum furvescens DSM 4134 TaxID=1122208 RepID=A0A3D9L2J5_MARFU|nr:A/G-specific adenine glycosylase [Marinoscillum furvescens]RED98961.1 A/G-specific DNA-adenine glycosylase [Marinoscillum furvescens DSM 4134]
MTDLPNQFANQLIDWYSRVKRDLPWRKTREPYNIWLSEIILQQTRVDQGLPYYNRFVEQFPTVHDLAAADTQEVLKLWEGLGYYSRARNLHSTAKHIANDLNGKFPTDYKGLLKLKGVGPYTAAAIASIAYQEAVPVLDGNVFRFASRYFGIQKDIAEQKNRQSFMNVLEKVIPHDAPDTFNQAMMEYGATVCKPLPACNDCSFAQACYAYTHKLQGQLPIKSKKVKVKEVYIDYLIFDHDGHTLMRKRQDSIWTGLFEFHNLSADAPISEEQIAASLKSYRGVTIEPPAAPVKHLLSHRKLWVRFFRVNISGRATFDQLAKDLELRIYSHEEVLTLPRPKVIVNHLHQVGF